MSKVALNEKQQDLKKIIEESLGKLREDINRSTLDIAERQKLYNEMSQAAHELHNSLDEEPKHHRYMIENRGVEPKEKEFYNHIHPVEDLLAYLEDTSANDDPEDQTIGEVFSMSVYSRRWGHKDNYELRRIDTGWEISFMSNAGECLKSGEPVLYEILKHDSINYPANLSKYMEYLWEIAKEEGLSKEQVQSTLDEISEWISMCEINSPSGVFGGYI